MNTTFKDTDLREALRRKYADMPQLPADFINRMRQQTKPSPKRHWRLGVAACFIIIIGIGATLMVDDWSQESGVRSQAHVEQAKAVLNQANLKDTLADCNLQPKPKPVPAICKQQPVSKPHQQASETHEVTPQPDPNLHYAVNVTQEDTTAYQDPARMDEFIAKLAAFHHVRQGELNCPLSVDSNMVSAVYVFPDKKEIDLFARLLQVACWYNCEMPGYFLNFSQRQFIFQLQDQRKQLKYSWIAERIGGKILLYGTNAPIGAEFSTACYQEYRDQLMNKRSINTKTMDI